jgi:hypothetical protein
MKRLVADMIDVVGLFCARLYGARSGSSRRQRSLFLSRLGLMLLSALMPYCLGTYCARAAGTAPASSETDFRLYQVAKLHPGQRAPTAVRVAVLVWGDQDNVLDCATFAGQFKAVLPNERASKQFLPETRP